jgi:hypothetical protein
VSDRAVYKNTGVETLDEVYSGNPTVLRAALEHALELLQDPQNDTLLDAAEKFVQQKDKLPDTTRNDLEHGWLPKVGTNADRIVRHGYKAAIQLALAGDEDDEPLPIETFFVTGASDQFELHVCEGRRQVTVLMLLATERDYGSENAPSRSWIVRAGRSGDTDAEVLEDGDPPIVKLQRSGP